jgi:hypothetical protein
MQAPSAMPQRSFVRSRFLLPTCLLAASIAGCGALDPGSEPFGQAEEVETATGALSDVGAWQNLSTPKGQDGAPTIVQVYDKQVAFSATAPLGGFPLSVYFSTRTVSGTGTNWSSWSALPFSPTHFKERPAAVAFDVPSNSPLAGKMALVGRKYDDTYYVRIQTPTLCGNCGNSGLVQNWLPIGGTWTSAPAVAFVPASSTTGPQKTLAIVGRGTDLRYYYTQNTLTAQNGYSHNNWTSPFALGPQTFNSAPAMTYSCAPGISLTVAGTTGSTMLFNSHNGFGFHPWNTANNGSFITGKDLALAGGCFGGGTHGETYAYGIGLGGQIWFSPVVDNLPTGWNPIGTTTFNSVAASAWPDLITVAGKTGTGTAPDFQAMSTSATLPACAPGDFCGANKFCELPSGTCGAQQGMCRYRPIACPGPIIPVCGCDGISYGNDCERQAGGVSKQSDGLCP